MAFLTILATAVITAGATQGGIWLKDHWILGREGKFSHLYAALFFEQYSEACSYMLGEKNAFISSDGHAGTDCSALPELPDFPKEIDWRRLGIRLTEDAFAFRVARQSAQSFINYLYEYDPPDGGDSEVQARAASLGLLALELARRIRKAARLKPAYLPDREHTSERFLTEQRDRLNEVRNRYLASQEASRSLLDASLNPGQAIE